jgi:hypothetical protein
MKPVPNNEYAVFLASIMFSVIKVSGEASFSYLSIPRWVSVVFTGTKLSPAYTLVFQHCKSQLTFVGVYDVPMYTGIVVSQIQVIPEFTW